MSRVALTPRPDLGITELIVGVDRVLGWFVQVWADPDGDPVIDEDGISNGRVVELMSLYGDAQCARNEKVQTLVVLDINPGEYNLPDMRTDYDRTTESMDDLTQTLNPEAPF